MRDELTTEVTEITGCSCDNENEKIWVSKKNEYGAYFVINDKESILVFAGDIRTSEEKMYLYADNIRDFKNYYERVIDTIKIDLYPEKMQENKIMSGEQFFDWVDQYELQMRLNLTEATAVFDTYTETGRELYSANGFLYQVYKKDDHQNRKVCLISVDDVIDIATEQNYEDVCRYKKHLINAKAPEKGKCSEAFNEYVKVFTKLQDCKYKDVALASAYAQTIYGKAQRRVKAIQEYLNNNKGTKKTV